MTTNTLIISATGQQRGYGTHPHKSAVHFTEAEGVSIRAWGRVFFRAARLSARGEAGTFWRVAIKAFGNCTGFFPRVPTPEEVKTLRAQAGGK